jgi:NAD(P)-dependent dehydrogenase (short-subunit alcohol dehydrogenase family)
LVRAGSKLLTRYMAKEFGERQIRVNAIAPGAIATDFGGGAVRDNPEVNKMVAMNTALGARGRADDIGAAISALLSDDCAWINGTRVEISDGQSL